MMDMDVNGVEAQLCFPNYPRFCGQQFLWGKDRELALLCVEAYNDWMVEEWCGTSGGRLLPLCLVPLWDADWRRPRSSEMRHAGVRAVAFSELPRSSTFPASTAATGIRSSRPAPRPPRWSVCTWVPGPRPHHLARCARCRPGHDPLRQQRGRLDRHPFSACSTASPA